MFLDRRIIKPVNFIEKKLSPLDPCEKHPTAELPSPPTEYRPDNSRSAQVSVIRRSEASLAVTSVEIVQIFTSPI